VELEEAREVVAAGSDSDRLTAARALASRAQPEDLQLLQDRLVLEEVPWIRRVLRDGVHRLEAAGHRPDDPPDLDVAPEVYENIYARVLEDVTRQVVHEVRSIVGTAEYYAEQLMLDYETTRAFTEFERIRDALRSVSLLGEAAAAPTFRQFDLAELIVDVAREEGVPRGIEVGYLGKRPFLVTSDSGLVEMVVRNAVRNACEATVDLSDRTGISRIERPITIRWQLANREFLIAILDNGAGLPANRSRAWEIGVTTKKGHSGVGLPTARRAAKSLDGDVALYPGKRGGTVFEFRFPVIEAAA
jgi:signal transduction histidine kinase